MSLIQPHGPQQVQHDSLADCQAVIGSEFYAEAADVVGRTLYDFPRVKQFAAEIQPNLEPAAQTPFKTTIARYHHIYSPFNPRDRREKGS
jgi:hypothetical protein